MRIFRFKKLISSGKIEYVGIGNTNVKAFQKNQQQELLHIHARRVIPDETLIPTIRKNGINYGGINEENF